MKDRVQMIITLALTGAYIWLVVNGKATVEGFVVLTTYALKKALDIIEDGGKNEKPKDNVVSKPVV